MHGTSRETIGCGRLRDDSKTRLKVDQAAGGLQIKVPFVLSMCGCTSGDQVTKLMNLKLGMVLR